MQDRLQADVIIPIHTNPLMTSNCVESVLANSGSAMRSLILVNDGAREREMPEVLARFEQRDPRVRVLTCEANMGFVGACNLGLGYREGDALLLNNDTIVTPGWLQELAEVVHSDPRTSCAAPLSNNATIFSVPAFDAETPADKVDAGEVLAACAGLPRWTEMSTCHGFCIYMNGKVLDLVGHLDPVFAPGYNEENDWVMRAKAMGFAAKRANRSFVYHLGTRSFRKQKIELEERNSRILSKRHPYYFPLVQGFGNTLDARLAAHAARVELSGKMRVALDLRHVSTERRGQSQYAVGLARALSGMSEVELTLVVRQPVQADGIHARLVSTDSGLHDVEVIHRPAPVVDPADLRLLFASSAHAVITHLDMVAHRVQALFPTQKDADRYRSTNAMALQAAQAIIASSTDTRREIVEEYKLPPEEIVVVPPAFADEIWGEDHRADELPITDLVPPGRFFLSVATDHPHKNLRNLIEAHAILRRCWSSSGDPPSLVLIGAHTQIWGGIYDGLDAAASIGVIHHVSATRDQLQALYRSAEALVFPSVYEGLGLPVREALSVGTPVVAMPYSAIPEIGGDCILYPNGFSASDLAQALERLATDSALRGELHERGLGWAERFTWEKTARATLDVYRSAVLQPPSRSLEMRRVLREAILNWAATCPSAGESSPYAQGISTVLPEDMGIINACRALNIAVHRRLRRELDRIPAVVGRKRA